MSDKKLIRILQIPGKMDYGGVSAVIMNYYRHLDKSRVQFDFAVNEDCTFPQEAELKEGGSTVYRVSTLKNVVKYMIDIYNIVKIGKYRIVHAHMNSLNIFPLFAAKMAGAEVRICHNHSTDAEGEFLRNFAKNIFKRFSKLFPTHYAACSWYAAEWLYGKKFCDEHTIQIIRNGIELEHFVFQEKIREEVRKQYGLNGKFVIGNVGRFVFQKNHDLLIDVFYEFYQKNKNAVLLLIGEGELQEKIRDKVNGYGIENVVIFTGAVKDTDRFYHAMDVFVLTSRYEGLPVTTIEAQTNGLPCVVSDAVPQEAIRSDNVATVKEYQDIAEWCKKMDAEKKRKENAVAVMTAYDINVCVKELEHYYIKILEN